MFHTKLILKHSRVSYYRRIIKYITVSVIAIIFRERNNIKFSQPIDYSSRICVLINFRCESAEWSLMNFFKSTMTEGK